jgi:hypothetical protein
LALAPQLVMLHQRRERFLLASRKNHPQVGHAFTRANADEGRLAVG